MSDIKILLIYNFDCSEYQEYNWTTINKYINETDLTYINEYIDSKYNEYSLIILANRELTNEEMEDLDNAGLQEFHGMELKSPNFDFLLYTINEEKEMLK